MRRVHAPAGDDGGHEDGDPQALAVQAGPARLRAAEVRHDELLDRVERRRQVRDELIAAVRAAVNHVGVRLHDLLEEGRALDGEIHALMQALIEHAPSRRQRVELEEIYDELAGTVISAKPRATAPVPSDERRPPGPARAAASVGEGWARGPEPEASVPTAPRPADRGALRTLFRRLAEALHPDKVQDEGERARRTEIMKQITVAYQGGDYAKLIALERTWASAIAAGLELDELADDADELERRLAARGRAIAELEAQLAEVEAELRALRTSDDGRLARAYRRHGGAAGVTPIELQAEDELVRMRDVRDFVVAFRAGTITFEQFRGGPRASRPPRHVADRGAVGDDDEDADDDSAGADDGDDGDVGEVGRTDPFDDPRLAADLRDAPPADLARMIADLEQVVRAEGLDPLELLRAIHAAAAGRRR